MAEDGVIAVKQARELHLQKCSDGGHVALERADDAGQNRHQLHGPAGGQSLWLLEEEGENPPEFTEVEIRWFEGGGRG